MIAEAHLLKELVELEIRLFESHIVFDHPKVIQNLISQIQYIRTCVTKDIEKIPDEI